ncbi:hypothetical protein HPB49_007382 [Dermacentor silvarum]|uniref:Uncharacterized protein n=1 Tax=Dermacentor silvarum TaxID=543639 RepID=A0ACB8CK24_DERSI|nr:hypothetical protein HPB49_007382 [Dermacentor silvarum]
MAGRGNSNYLHILTWNCRGFRGKRAPLQLLLPTLSPTPQVLLLQDTATQAALPGYNSTHSDTTNTPRASTLVHRTLTHKTHYITSETPCVITEIIHHTHTLPSIFIANIYQPPSKPMATLESLLRELHRLVGKHPLLIGGDFNNQHTDWGYKTTTHRGRRLWLLLQNLQLSVHNNFQTPTRIGNSVSMDTSPDLVLSCSLRDVTWTRTQHTLCSDHYMIQVTVPFKPPRHTYMTHKLINWDALRTTRTATPDNPITDINDWVDSLQTDIQHHTQQIETTTDVPTLDSRLAHLWEAYHSLLERWKRGKHNRTLRKRLATLQSQIQLHSEELCRSNWGQVCDGIAGRLSAKRAWQLLRHLIDPINKDGFSIACYRALPAAMDQLEEEWRPPTLDDPWRLQLWPYRPHSPIVWFAQVDAQLYVNGVSSQLWRYLLLKREIQTDVLSRLHLPSSDQNMYEGLKTAFFNTLAYQFPITYTARHSFLQRLTLLKEWLKLRRPLHHRRRVNAAPLLANLAPHLHHRSHCAETTRQLRLPRLIRSPTTNNLPPHCPHHKLHNWPEHTKESSCTPSPPELHDVPSPSRGDDSAASRALTAVETHISPPVPSEILRQHCGDTGPPAITCTALPSYASVFPVEPLSPAPSRSARSVSRLQRPNHTALTFGHKDASPACGARHRKTRAQRGRQPRCFAGFRRCVHPILHRWQAGRCYRALRKRPPSTPNLCSRVRLTFTRWHHANFNRANRVPSSRACHHGRSISGCRIRCCCRRRRTPPPASPLDQPKLGRCHRGCRVPRTVLRSTVHAHRPYNICICNLEREWRRPYALRDAGIIGATFHKLPPPKPHPLLHSQARPPQ